MNGIGAVRPDQRAERFLQPQFQPGDAEELFGGGVQWITAVDPVPVEYAPVRFGPADRLTAGGLFELAPALGLSLIHI